jgi:hypothetical protein
MSNAMQFSDLAGTEQHAALAEIANEENVAFPI